MATLDGERLLAGERGRCGCTDARVIDFGEARARLGPGVSALAGRRLRRGRRKVVALSELRAKRAAADLRAAMGSSR